MKRIVVVQKEINKCDGPLTPAAHKIFEEIKTQASKFHSVFNGHDKFQVSNGSGEQFVVDMIKLECSCRHWELTGIPCKHAVATMWNMALNGEKVSITILPLILFNIYCHLVYHLVYVV